MGVNVGDDIFSFGHIKADFSKPDVFCVPSFQEISLISKVDLVLTQAVSASTLRTTCLTYPLPLPHLILFVK